MEVAIVAIVAAAKTSCMTISLNAISVNVFVLLAAQLSKHSIRYDKVFPFVRHTVESRLNGSRYLNTCCTLR